MRSLVLVFLALVVAPSYSQDNESSERGKQRAAKQRAGSVPPIVVNVLPPAKTPEESKREEEERREKAEMDRKLVKLTGDLAEYTADLATVTMAIAALALLQLIAFSYQGWQLKRTVDSTEDSSSPYVFPNLHDVIMLVDAPQGFKPTLKIELWNHGKTPAIMKQARFELHIFDRIEGRPQFTKLASDFSSFEVISAESASRFPRKYRFHRSLSGEEILQVRKKVEDAPFLRFYLTGEIKYADFFGYTHTVGCCFKIFGNNAYLVKDYRGYSYKRKERTKETGGDTEPPVVESKA